MYLLTRTRVQFLSAVVNNISHLIQHSSSPFVHEKVAVMSFFAEECRSCFQTGQVSEGGNVSKHASNNKAR